MIRTIIDTITAIVFWSFTYFAFADVHEFFRKGAVQNIERGLGSTTKFTESLIEK